MIRAEKTSDNTYLCHPFLHGDRDPQVLIPVGCRISNMTMRSLSVALPRIYTCRHFAKEITNAPPHTCRNAVRTSPIVCSS